MAQLLLVAHPDPNRRTAAIARATRAMPQLPDGRHHSHSIGDIALDLTVSPSTPVDMLRAPDGAWILVVGGLGDDAREGESPAATIDRLRSRHGPADAVAGRDEIHFSVVVEPDGSLWIGVDALGLFPLCWHADRDGCIAGTHPGIVHAARGTAPRIDPAGLAGILLTMHAVGGRSLVEGVHRLPPGSGLRWRPGSTPSEFRASETTGIEPPPATTRERRAWVLDAFSHAVASSAGNGDDALMLSGGIDSRLVAGVLARLGRNPEAITLGDPDDQEMRVAATVADRLGWRHTRLPVFRSDPVGDAFALLDTEHLGGGFNHCIEWEGLPPLSGKPRRLHTGLVGDATMGASHVEWARDPETNQFTFESLFGRINRYGFSPDTLREILRPCWREGIEEALVSLRAAWAEGGDDGWRRSWAFDLAHRQRFHVAGMGWRLARGAWTTLPFARRRLRHALAAMPYDELKGRAVQIALLAEEFPELARLPLDRNSHDTTPLLVDSAIQHAWNQTGARALRRLRRHLERNREDRRFYYRVHAVDGTGWRAIRDVAEPFRERLHAIFFPEAVDRLLPRPADNGGSGDGIVDATRTRTTIGLALWLGRHLP